MFENTESVRKWSWITVKNLGWAFGVCTAVLGVLWTVARPHAETFVKETAEQAVSTRFLAVEASQNKTEESLDEIKTKAQDAARERSSIKTKIDGVEKLQYEILRSLRAFRPPSQ